MPSTHKDERSVLSGCSKTSNGMLAGRQSASQWRVTGTDTHEQRPGGSARKGTLPGAGSASANLEKEMRISADQKDTAFNPLYARTMVYLDGKLLSSVIIADDERGEVTCLKEDHNGCIVTDRNGMFERITLSGTVQIVVSELS